MKLLFADVGITKQRLTKQRLEKYQKWVVQAQEARIHNPLDAGLNQYDKAEELISWYTFAPIERLPLNEKVKVVTRLCRIAGVLLRGNLANTSKVDVLFERDLPPPRKYLEWLSEAIKNHPVPYIKKQAESKPTKNFPPNLEGPTQVDVLVDAGKVLILIEVKFTADIGVHTKFGLVRNQLARMVDVGLDIAEKRKCSLIALMCTPSQLFNSQSRLYYFKVKDYLENIKNLQKDLPHRSLDEIKSSLLGIGFLPLEKAVQAVYQACQDCLDSEEISELKRFFNERKIPFPL